MILGLNHYSFTVSNLDRAMVFYRDVIGLDVISCASRPRDFSEQVTGVRGCSLNIAYLRGFGLTLELIEYVGSHKNSGRSASDNIGAGHVCFNVDNLSGTMERYRRKGVEFTCEPVAIPAGANKGGLVVYASDPDGIVIEFIEQPAASQRL